MESSTSTSTSPPPHILLFPFMSKGHTIPLLHLATLLHRHRPRATFTVFTTTANHPFISYSLSSSIPPHLLSIISLSFPTSHFLPATVESTDQLPSMSLFPAFVSAVELLQPAFETALQNLLHGGAWFFLISDGFLYWTQQSASKFCIPRLAFYGMSGYAQTISRLVGQHGLSSGPQPDDEPVQVPDFPWIKITRNDLCHPFNLREPKGPEFDFIVKCGTSDSKSYGLLMNSFYELESKFLDYFNSRFGPRSWPIGPFCAMEGPKLNISEKPVWVDWLDRREADNKSVLYIAFGSQAEISNEQLKEILIGLEDSDVDFLWALRIKPNQEEIMEGFDERVKDRGLVLKEWAQQREILAHESVKGFLSHCGWNSVTESICAGVPILAWPMMADQHLNTRMVVEEIRVGLRVEACDGSVRGFVKAIGLSKMVNELINGEKGKEVRKRVQEISVDANKAIEEGGSSWHSLELLLTELEAIRNVKHDSGVLSDENGCHSTLTKANGVHTN